MMPVYLRTLNKKTKSRESAYVLREESVIADEFRSDLNTQLRSLLQFFKWHRFPFTEEDFVALGILVLPLMYGQFIFPHGSITCQTLWDYFHQGRRSYNLKASWRPFNGTNRRPRSPELISFVHSWLRILISVYLTHS